MKQSKIGKIPSLFLLARMIKKLLNHFTFCASNI